MRKIRLRTKFLLSLVAITAGLTTATLLVVRLSIEKRVRESIREDLRTSVSTYRSFEKQRETMLTHSAELIANLPNVRALMTTRDLATIQDASEGIWRLSGSDLLVLADRSGNMLALRTSAPGSVRESSQALLRDSLEQGEERNWWYTSGHLFEVWIKPIYFGAASENAALGYLAVGHEIDEEAAKNFSNVVTSEVAFHYESVLIASSLAASQQPALMQFGAGRPGGPGETPQEIQLGSERYLMTTVRLSPVGAPEVSLSVLKSFDKAAAFLNTLNHVLLGLGFVSVMAGGALVFLISDTFTRPLANLVAGVRALEKGDFDYPLGDRSGDEVGEVTGAFDRMRANLQRTLKDQKQLEDRLRQAHKMEAVGRLAGGVAHDFNNLLTIIRGHSDLLMDRADSDDNIRRNIEQVQKAANRAVAMTRQLLAFSRKQVLQPRIVDLNSVVADMGKMLPRLIGEHIEFIFVPDPKLASVMAVPGQIEQVIMNLAVNARDAMEGGGKLTIRTFNISLDEETARQRAPMPPGPYVLLSVSDTGHGMDAVTRAHIFEPFFTTKEVGKGTGLGLATVYGVVKQSGGFIYVESTTGNGATFEVYLPQAAEKSAQGDAEARGQTIPNGSETVLVAEDETGVRELACEFLRSRGYCVLEAKDGQEAMEVAMRHTGPLHLVLTDIVMPRMSGGELAEKLKKLRPETKILYMTGYSEYLSGQAGQSISPAAILQKPFSLRSLVEKVCETLAQRVGGPVSRVKERSVT